MITVKVYLKATDHKINLQIKYQKIVFHQLLIRGLNYLKMIRVKALITMNLTSIILV